MEDDSAEHGDIIIVKRGHDDHDDHHGGVWKIAFADFMTAMMAFFLVMWLINASNEQTRKSVASYFNPIKLMDTTSNPKGVKNPKYGVEQQDNQEDEESTKVTSPVKKLVPSEAGDTSYDEKALFADPFALLSEIEGGISEDADSAIAPNENRPATKNGIGLNGGVSFQDPSVWNIREGNIKAGEESSEKEDPSEDEKLTGEQVANIKPDEKSFLPGENEEQMIEETEEPEDLRDELEADKSPQIPGGNPETSKELAEQLNNQIEALKENKNYAELNIEVVEDGSGAIVILSDKSANGMFNIGSARPMPALVKAMANIGKIISEQKGRLEISGHTDGRKYQSGEYDNWRLSTARAHMAYYMLVRGGMQEDRVEKIVGQADVRLKVPEDPLSAANRRIEVLLKVE